MTTVLLLSGGVDSAFLAKFVTPDVALFVDYGQAAAAQERRAAKRIAGQFGWLLTEAEIRGFEPGPLAVDDQVSNLVSARYVLARNAMLLSIAANRAGGAGRVFIGCTPDDRSQYLDCRPLFLDAMNEAFFQAYGVSVVYSEVDRSERKRQTAEVATWSCYLGGDEPCGKCGSCRQ